MNQIKTYNDALRLLHSLGNELLQTYQNLCKEYPEVLCIGFHMGCPHHTDAFLNWVDIDTSSVWVQFGAVSAQEIFGSINPRIENYTSNSLLITNQSSNVLDSPNKRVNEFYTKLCQIRDHSKQIPLALLASFNTSEIIISAERIEMTQIKDEKVGRNFRFLQSESKSK